MRFHKEGYPTLMLTITSGLLITVLSYYFLNQIFFILAIILSLFLLITVLQFFRDPNRKLLPEDLNKIYTPADGKIVLIEKTFEAEFLKSECWMVSVFMSPLNVHINRNPVSGEVSYTKYHPGKYLAAWNPKASIENERYTTAYRSQNGNILIRQIAGALARRIVNYVKTGDPIVQGKEMGFIKFGSRVDIFLPLNAKIKVELDQIVKSPIDLIAEI